jgi:hypothetical protein
MKKEEVSLKEFSEFIKGYEMCASYKIEKEKLTELSRLWLWSYG